MARTKKPAPPVHPMAVGGNRPRPTGRGRPPSEGSRHPGGQLVQRVEANPRVLAERLAICKDPRHATCPLDAAFANGWISQEDHNTGTSYFQTYSRSDLGSPGARVANDFDLQSESSELKVRGKDWSELTNAEILNVRYHDVSHAAWRRIWDNAFNVTDATPDGSNNRSMSAMRRWKQMSAAMTSEQRLEVDAVCIRHRWPRWIFERAAGRMDTEHEKDRKLLVAGLAAIRARAKKKAGNDNAFVPAAEPRNDNRPALIEVGQVEDDNGRLFTLERRYRKAPTA